MKLGLSNYRIFGAFDSDNGNHYLVFCNRTCTRHFPVILMPHQREIILGFMDGSAGLRGCGIYTAIIDMWAGVECSLSAIMLKMADPKVFPKTITADFVLTQFGEDGLSVLHTPFCLSDAAVLSVITGVPLFIGSDVSHVATLPVEAASAGETVMDRIRKEVNQCEKIMGLQQPPFSNN